MTALTAERVVVYRRGSLSLRLETRAELVLFALAHGLIGSS